MGMLIRRHHAGTQDAADTAPAFPDGAPAKAWKVDELVAFAAAKSIDLGEAKKKDDILAVLLTASSTPVPDPADAAVPDESSEAEETVTDESADAADDDSATDEGTAPVE